MVRNYILITNAGTGNWKEIITGDESEIDGAARRGRTNIEKICTVKKNKWPTEVIRIMKD